MALPEHFICEQCGVRFLMDFCPVVLCAAHGEDEHCHTGYRELCADGSWRYAASSPDCLPFATSDYLDGA